MTPLVGGLIFGQSVLVMNFGAPIIAVALLLPRHSKHTKKAKRFV